MMLSVYQILLLDKLKDKSNMGHSTTRSRLSSLTEVPLKHMDWYSYICLGYSPRSVVNNIQRPDDVMDRGKVSSVNSKITLFCPLLVKIVGATISSLILHAWVFRSLILECLHMGGASLLAPTTSHDCRDSMRGYEPPRSALCMCRAGCGRKARSWGGSTSPCWPAARHRRL
jgi:hypothetical protein